MAWSEKYVSVAGGGAHDGSSEANAWTLAEAIAGVAAGDRCNVIAGTYTYGASVLFATAGTTTAPIWWRGYKTTPGDLDVAGGSRVPATDLPLISLTDVAYQIISAGAHQIFSNLAVTSICTTVSGAWNASGGNQRFIRCQIENTQAATHARAISTVGPTLLVGCFLKVTTTSAFCVSVGGFTKLIGCQMVGGITGISAGEYTFVSDSTISGFATNGITFSTATRFCLFDHMTIYAAATNCVLVSVAPTTGALIMSNCIFGGCTNGINNNTGVDTNGVTLISNQFYACTNNIIRLTEQADVTADLTASTFNIDNDTDPWVDKASANFNLASGAVAKSTAFPGAFDDPSGTPIMTGYPDIGAVRHIDPSSGTTISVVTSQKQRNLPDIRVW